MKLAGSSVAATVQGQVVETTATPEGLSTLPKTVRPNSQWRYKAHPARWDWSEEYGWHPVLGRWHMDNGLDGVSITAKGYQGLGVARQRNMDRGWTIIELGDHRLGKFAKYLQGFPTTKGRPHHISIFHTPEVQGKLVDWRFDTESYKEFLELIVGNAVVPPLLDMVKRSKIRNQERIVAKLEQDMFETPTNPMLRVRYEREARKLAGMRGEDVKSAIEQAHIIAQQAMGKRATDADRDKADQDALAELAKLTENNVVTCPDCDRTFPSQASLDGHKAHCKGRDKGGT